MRLSWLILAILSIGAIAGGVYYVTTRVEVKVEMPKPVASPSAPPKAPVPDTFGKMETARNPKFPGQFSSKSNTSPEAAVDGPQNNGPNK